MLCKILPLKTFQAKELMVTLRCRWRCVLRPLCKMVCVEELDRQAPWFQKLCFTWMLYGGVVGPRCLGMCCSMWHMHCSAAGEQSWCQPLVLPLNSCAAGPFGGASLGGGLFPFLLQGRFSGAFCLQKHWISSEDLT